MKHETFSWTEFLEAATKRHSDVRFGDRASRKRDQTMSFRGTATFEDAVRLATGERWEAGHAAYEAQKGLLAEIVQGSTTERQITVHDVCGSTVDIGRFVEGEPENMMEFATEIVEQHGKFLKIVANIGSSAAYSVQQFIDRGLMVVVLIDILENAGFRCEVEILAASSGEYSDKVNLSTVRVKIKEHGDALDIDRMLFALAHPAMYRRFIFSVWESWDSAERRRMRVPGAYGYPQQVTDGDEDITIPAMQLWVAGEAATEWVRAQLARFVSVEAAA